ncbi:MAG: 2-dehydro-3-deoxyphosphooctonate aldolase [Bacteroidota bacterium]
MRLLLSSVALCFVLMGCGGAKTSTAKTATGAVAGDYGYSEKNPIKVGGVNSGPANERAYLNRLTGPNGEAVTYVRKGSCCQFETPNSSWGGMLDVYIVTIAGDPVKKELYINMYDKDELHAPKGFILK